MDPYRIGKDLMTPIHQLEEHLFIGNKGAIRDPAIILFNNITKVIQLLPERLSVPYEGQTVEVLHIPIGDSPENDLTRFLPTALQFIQRNIENRQNVLVHCSAGASRSGAIVVAYYMASQQLLYNAALQRVQQFRACVDPNEGFKQQLEELSPSELQSYLI